MASQSAGSGWRAGRAHGSYVRAGRPADEITVRIPDPSLRDDTSISDTIQGVFRNHVEVPATVKAEVHDGTVILSGEVSSQHQRRKTGRLVRVTTGAKDVVNRITVKPKVRADDVVQRVSHALKGHPDLGARSVWVTSQNGTVCLHGHVRSLREGAVAQNVAFETPGVMSVDNQLEVGP